MDGVRGGFDGSVFFVLVSLALRLGAQGLLGFRLLLVACSVPWPHGSCWVKLAASFAWTTDRSAAMLKGEMTYHGPSEWSVGFFAEITLDWDTV
ncbi:hypothetical protein U1Q18_025519 [Sarracenia purpurea var. burkii]